MTPPRWISKQALLILQERTIALHGGARGLRDDGLLESALARPINRFEYEGLSDRPMLAATYLVALASNHAFVDGNRRAAFLGCGLFLHLNGLRFVAAQADAVRTVLKVAAGERDLDELAAWITDRSEPL